MGLGGMVKGSDQSLLGPRINLHFSQKCQLHGGKVIRGKLNAKLKYCHLFASSRISVDQPQRSKYSTGQKFRSPLMRHKGSKGRFK